MRVRYRCSTARVRCMNDRFLCRAQTGGWTTVSLAPTRPNMNSLLQHRWARDDEPQTERRAERLPGGLGVWARRPTEWSIVLEILIDSNDIHVLFDCRTGVKSQFSQHQSIKRQKNDKTSPEELHTNSRHDTAYAIDIRVATGTHGSAEDWRRDIKRRLLWHQATLPRFPLAQTFLTPFLHTASDVLSLLLFVLPSSRTTTGPNPWLALQYLGVVCRGYRLTDCLHVKTGKSRTERVLTLGLCWVLWRYEKQATWSKYVWLCLI
jgi:hypothetical protein